MRIQEKDHAVITGGASGLGAATAEALANLGVNLTLFDMNEEDGKKIAHELTRKYQIKAQMIKVDVSHAGEVENSFKLAREKLGQESILVNCAGIAPAMKTVSRGMPHDAALFAKTIQVNLIGTFIVASHSAAGMASLPPRDEIKQRGVIINTASVAAFDGQIGQVAYGASKGGVASMTLPMARDLSDKGIRVVTIAPGIFATPMLQTMPIEIQESLAQMVPFPKRLGRGEDYAKLVLHIIENDMLNGEIIRLDGAIRMAAK